MIGTRVVTGSRVVALVAVILLARSPAVGPPGAGSRAAAWPGAGRGGAVVPRVLPGRPDRRRTVRAGRVHPPVAEG